MMRRIVGLMISCMKDQGIHIEFKEKYNKKETMCSSAPQVEETSNLVEDSEEEHEEEVWVEAKDRSSTITAHSWDI
jgi:fatty acid-binding protein DegV